MKLMIASDLHGSYEYTKELFERFQEEKPEKLILLGDLLYHGPRNELPNGHEPKELFALLNAHKKDILAVRGNCDAAVDQMVLEFPIMADYLLLYTDGLTMFLTHGDQYNENIENFYTPGTVLIHGHTHLKVMEKHGEIYYLNPGSLSLPKDDQVHSYMVYEDHRFIIKDLQGNPIREMEIK